MNNYTHIDYNRNEIRKVALEPLTVAPLNPSVGQTYFDLTLDSLRTWNGVRWLSNADFPIASEIVLGAIRIGERLTIDPDTGVLSADIQSDNNLTDELLQAILDIPNTISDHNNDISAHPYLSELISQEIIDRQNGDILLQNSIDTEMQRAISAESNLQQMKEDKANKTQIIDSSSSSDHYPSAKAVYDALQNKVDANKSITASTEYRVVRYDSKGLVTDGRKIINADISGGIDASKIGNGTISNTEFQQLNGVTSNIQTQLNNLNSGKANKINGTTDLKDVRDELSTEINNLQDIIGDKDFPETVTNRLKTLSNIPTVLQADSNKYIVSYINIVNPGSDYKLGDKFQLGQGGTIPVVVSSTDINGGITQLTWDTNPIGNDISGKNLRPQSYSGNGTDATFDLFSRYATGDTVTDGELLYVPVEDPLVQFSRMKGYVEDALAAQDKLDICGFICNTDPSSQIDTIPIGSMWYQNNSTGFPNTNFPWHVKTWDGAHWSSSTVDYRPDFNDIWSNLNVTDPLTSKGYYWFQEWLPYGFTFDPTSFVHTTGNQTIAGTKTFSSTIKGNIETANKLKTPRTIALENHVVGSASFDGSANISISATIQDNTIKTSMLQNSSVTTDKIASTTISNATYAYNKNKYANSNSNTYQNWINSFASKANWLLDNKNKIFVQSSTPTANNTGDLWIQTVS